MGVFVSKESSGVSRRAFVKGGGAAAGASMVRLAAPVLAAAAQAACEQRDAAQATEEAVSFVTLTAEEGRELEAIAARILPTTDTPGAREAGVVHFFDTVLGGPMADMLGPIRQMLPGFLPEDGRLSALDDAAQDAWLTEREDTPLFGMLRALTLMGFFSMSKYGGNRDNVGWELIGFADHGPTSYPFGHYDAEYRGETLAARDAGAGEGAHHGH